MPRQATYEHTKIAVIESNWYKDSNVSVHSLFDVISDITCGSPHAYHYERANCEAAMKEAIPRIAKDRRIKYLYIATHGEEDALQLYNGDNFTRTELKNQLIKIKNSSGSTLRGLYLGSCLVGSSNLADFLFADDIAPRWIAGYDKKISWVQSSALDMLFFNELIDADSSSGAETPRMKIESIAKFIGKAAPGLVKDLGFGIYVRKKGNGGAKDLLAAVKGAVTEK